jgi:putative membrane protein
MMQGKAIRIVALAMLVLAVAAVPALAQAASGPGAHHAFGAYGHRPHGPFGPVVGLFLLLWVLLLIGILLVIWRVLTSRTLWRRPDSAIQIVRERFAKGEISEEEYRKRLSTLA